MVSVRVSEIAGYLGSALKAVAETCASGDFGALGCCGLYRDCL